MNKRHYFVFFRNNLIGLSIILFLCAFIFLVKSINTSKNNNLEPQAPVEVRHRVLFLSSYNPFYFTNGAQIRGLEKSLYPKGIEYDVVYMDRDSFLSINDVYAFHDYLKNKLQNHSKYEALLVGDDAALKFVLDYQDELFPKMPVVFFSINSMELVEQALQSPYMIGFYENGYLNETMKLAVKLFPNRKKLVALHDQSDVGKNDFETFKELCKEYKDYALIDVDTSVLTQGNLIFLLESLPNDSMLFYMTCYTDKSGKVYSMLSRTNTIVQHTDVPIFRNYIGGEGKGILGGIYMDFEEQCFMAGNVLYKILNGAEITKLPFIEQTPSRCDFDYSLMKKYNLDFSLLPSDTIFYNQPDTFLHYYGKILPSAVLIVLALVFLVLSSHLGSRSSKLMLRDLQLSHDNLEKYQEQLLYQAEYDEFLDILNRRTITDTLRNTLTEKDSYSVLIIDIDGFKSLNENYGHSMADSILQYLTALLKGISEENGWKIARFGGDEYLIFIPNEVLTAECESVKKILDGIRSPIPLGDESLGITASIGASCSDGVTLPEQHIINAESAMYEAKERGKNGIVIYDEQMKKKVREEAVIKEKLQHAFDNDGFFMLYQPQIDTKTKKVSGYEALVRMKEPGIYPGQFIPVAERSGWIWRIGRITTELVIKQLALWRDEGKELHPVSVNYSSNQLNDYGYVDFLEELLKKYDVPAHYLEIEITEGVFLEKSTLADEIFKRFKVLGIRLLMDDFGTGYSSLGYLTYIPVDVIKLDKSLVDTYLVDGKDSFIKNIIHLMHDLDKDMIIEGVEEEWQYNRLLEFGADKIQGYYFSKPIPANEAIVFEVK
ncbi:EAL domain-containing protein [Treponema sp.]|uniref:EAL domain-containing protein n=1 Tax=Treponema sp. TaxID=166 RepID=UPI00388ECA7E